MMEVMQRLRSILLRRDAAVDTNYHSDEEEGGDEEEGRVTVEGAEGRRDSDDRRYCYGAQ